MMGCFTIVVQTTRHYIRRKRCDHSGAGRPARTDKPHSEATVQVLAVDRAAGRVVQFTNFNLISTVDAFMILYRPIYVPVKYDSSYTWRRKKATGRVWEGTHGLKWTVPSRASYRAFETPPQARTD